MVCPYCGKEMEHGCVQSARPVLYSPRKKKVFFTASEPEEFYLTDGVWNGSFVGADYCKDCKKVVISLEK